MRDFAYRKGRAIMTMLAIVAGVVVVYGLVAAWEVIREAQTLRVLESGTLTEKAEAAERLQDSGTLRSLSSLLASRDHRIIGEGKWRGVPLSFLYSDAVREIIKRHGNAGVMYLIQSLGQDDPRVTAQAAQHLGYQGDSAAKAVPHLVDVLCKGVDPEARQCAAQALGWIRRVQFSHYAAMRVAHRAVS